MDFGIHAGLQMCVCVCVCVCVCMCVKERESVINLLVFSPKLFFLRLNICKSNTGLLKVTAKQFASPKTSA